MVVLKAAAVITTEETKVIEAIEAVAPSATIRTIVTIGGAVILTPTSDVTTRRPRNVSTRTTRMAPTYGTGTFANWPADSLTRSPLGLAVVKGMEEVDAALIATKAMDEAVEDFKAVAAFRAMDAATTMTTMVAVAKVITTEIKAHIMEAPHKDLTIRATGAATITMCTRLQYSLDNKVAWPARAFTTLLCLARS